MTRSKPTKVKMSNGNIAYVDAAPDDVAAAIRRARQRKRHTVRLGERTVPIARVVDIIPADAREAA